MPKGRLYTEAEDWAILRADRPRKAHIEDCAAVLGRSVAAVRRRGCSAGAWTRDCATTAGGRADEPGAEGAVAAGAGGARRGGRSGGGRCFGDVRTLHREPEP